MPKELTDQEIKATFDAMNKPGSGTRQLADWYARDGEGPVPDAVQQITEVIRSIPHEVRRAAKARMGKPKD